MNERIESFGFTRCKSDTCVYYRVHDNRPIILALFVDDIIVIHAKQHEREWQHIKSQFQNAYKVKDISDSQFILGMKITRTGDSLSINQESHTEQLLKKYNMSQCKPMPTPEASLKLKETVIEKEKDAAQQIDTRVDVTQYQSVVGALLYLSLCTRPDISHSVHCVSKYIKSPGPEHWKACKRILRYLRATTKLGLLYERDICRVNLEASKHTVELTAYCDADWSGDVDDRKSTSGMAIYVDGCLVHWASKKQATVSLSSAEAEYMSISSTVQELKWIQSLLTELDLLSDTAPILYCDSQSAIQISENDKHHNRTKHIDIRHHFVRDAIRANRLELKWLQTDQQPADILTKGLDQRKFEKLRYKLMKYEAEEA